MWKAMVKAIESAPKLRRMMDPEEAIQAGKKSEE